MERERRNSALCCVVCYNPLCCHNCNGLCCWCGWRLLDLYDGKAVVQDPFLIAERKGKKPSVKCGGECIFT